MKKYKHTPGPWKWDGANKLCGEFGLTVAIRARAPYASTDYEEDCANQCLLCAAPELLEAAECVMDMLKEHGPSIVPHLLDSDDNAGQQLRNAIAKAKGKNI